MEGQRLYDLCPVGATIIIPETALNFTEGFYISIRRLVYDNFNYKHLPHQLQGDLLKAMTSIKESMAKGHPMYHFK